MLPKKEKFSFYKVSNRKCYACAFCGHQLHPLANTIFHKSSTSLKNWFYAIFLFSTSKNGVSAKEIERQLGVTYKCAYRIAQKIRTLFNEDIKPLDNTVKIDKTYYGSKESNKHLNKRVYNTQGRSVKSKNPIIEAIERKGNIVAKVVGNTKSSTLRPFIRQHVSIKANINTDEYKPYKSLKRLGYKHNVVEHGKSSM